MKERLLNEIFTEAELHKLAKALGYSGPYIITNNSFPAFIQHLEKRLKDRK